MKTLSLPCAALLALAACAPTTDEHHPHSAAPKPEEVDHDVELTVNTAELEEAFVPEDTRMVSPAIDLEEGADQVGVMLTLEGRTDAPPLWVRGRDGDVVGAWQEVEWTFHEDALLAGKGRLDGVYLSVEVAVDVVDAASVAQLTFAPAVMAEPADESEPGLDLEEAAAEESALHPAMAYVGVKPRSAWGARAHRCSTQEPNGHYWRAALHHGGSQAWSNVEGYLRQAQAYHMDGRNYCDIAYHFGVSIDGRVFELRPQPYRGGHTYNNNTGNVGVLFIGCFHPTCGNDPVTPQLIEAGAGTLAMLNLIHGLPINDDKVRGHRDHSYASTACPGNTLYSRLGDIRARAGQILAQQNSPPPPPPPPGPAPAPPEGCGWLGHGSSLAPGQGVTSCDGRFLFVHQGDGNVVLYKQGVALWHTGTHGQSTNVLAMQGDGNLVIYGPNNAVRWATGTHGHHNASLAVQDDGNVVIYTPGGTPVWSTGTHGH